MLHVRTRSDRQTRDRCELTSDPTLKAEVSPMILERLTAWTLVVVYYTVTCGAILLGLRGAL